MGVTLRNIGPARISGNDWEVSWAVVSGDSSVIARQHSLLQHISIGYKYDINSNNLFNKDN
ncbi:hypothetical protein H744_1c0455 [Photobacterium gaetbulicola Gung47]|uniref:Uncharacterized protein n=1 Tax=Photobacterium gaetbulicola Gung47 TaxID=658445 RepID=A0A0C5WR94_9GAMM|nr:hypothetical protein H744_1c0455 [Photobacterium gaetbulicola Gung47]